MERRPYTLATTIHTCPKNVTNKLCQYATIKCEYKLLQDKHINKVYIMSKCIEAYEGFRTSV